MSQNLHEGITKGSRAQSLSTDIPVFFSQGCASRQSMGSQIAGISHMASRTQRAQCNGA